MQKFIRLFWICFLLIPHLVKAQDPYIFSNDLYSGISAVGISPTQAFLNPNAWDFHLISENVFIQNKYGYISKSSLLGLGKGEVKEADIRQGTINANSKKLWNYYNFDQTGYHFSSELMGPSASFHFQVAEKDFVAGVFTKLRTQSSILKVDNYLQFENQNLLEPVLYNLQPFDATFMNWSEVGLNLSTELFPYSDFQWIAGINLKYLMGHDAFYVNNKSDALMRREFVPHEEIDSVDVKNLYISNFDVEVGYTTGYDFDSESYSFKPQGNGMGLDVGLTLVNSDSNEGYNFKASVNVLDIGQIAYDGFVHSFQGDDFQYTNNPSLNGIAFENPEQIAQIISNEIYGNPNQSLISNRFKMGLPTSIHLNVSQNVGYQHYVNLNLIQRFPIFENSLKRSNILNVSYLFSSHKMGYGGSVSLYEYEKLQIGAFLRYGPFVIGSENVLPLFLPQKKLHAADIYFGIKIYPFKNRDIERRSREDCRC